MFGSLGKLVMAGRLQAVAIAVTFAVLALFLPPFSLISGAAVGLVTLRKGWQAGLSIIGLGALVLAVLGLGLDSPMMGLSYGLSQWLPVWLLALVLRQSGSWAMTFQLGVGVLAVAVLMAHALIPDLELLWQELLNKILEPVLQQTSSQESETLKAVIPQVSGLMTGIIAVSVLTSSTLALLMARAWQAQLFNPGGFSQEFQALRLGNWPAIVAVVFFVLAVLLKQSSLQELLLLILVPFFFQGLAVMHALNRKFGWHAAVLIVMYVLMFIALPQMMAMLTATGLIDSFADFRRRLTPKVG
jgi:hypothetical protein